MRLSPVPLSAALVVVGSCAWFVISTITMDQIPDTALMAASLLVALAFVSAFAGTPSRERVTAAGGRDLVFAAAAGVITWFAPLMIVLTQRATDAPSGTEMLFFTTAAWAMLGSLLALGLRDDRPTPTQVTAVALAVVGAAAVLANWERPSSFSPFVKFPLQEGVILAAGVLFAFGLVMGRRSGRVLGTRTSLWIGMAAAAALATLIALPYGFGSAFTLGRIWPQLLLAGASLATLATGMTGLVRVSGLTRATSWLLVAPVALTALSVVERMTVVYGPNPLVLGGVLGGMMLVVMGLLIVQFYPAPRATSSSAEAFRMPQGSIRFARVSQVLAALAMAAGAIALFLPAFFATAVGTTDSGEAFKVTWALLGAESAIGWLAFLGSSLVLALTVDVLRTASTRRLMTTAIATSVALGAYPLLIQTPLRTWNRWIPAEIQQAYGTEYARLTIDAVPGIVGLASAGLALAACIALMAAAIRGRKVPESVASSPEENE